MSPYPAQVTRDHIIQTAWALIEREGVETLSLNRLAAALGIKAPSLYRHVANKAEVLKAVNEVTGQRLFTAIGQALGTAAGEAYTQMLAVAHAYRGFAHAHPVVYMLAFTTVQTEECPDAAEQEAQAIPLQHIMAAISGEEHSLAALRGAQALMHGFIMLELNQQFRRGGDVDAAFRQSMEAYLRGWQRNQSA